MNGLTKFFAIVTSELLQFAIYAALSLAVIIATGVLYAQDKVIYQDFFGRFNPLLVLIAVSVLGFILFAFLLARDWFAIFSGPDLQGWAVAAGLAVLLALAMIFFDSRIILPQDVNRPFPASLLFYPTMGFVAEIIFHILPLTLLLLVSSLLFKSLTFAQLVWPCILLVALWEPVFQTRFSHSGGYPWTAVIFIAVHNFLFNFIQLALFKRCDFVTMYGFRLVYYLLWHIVWGVIRLRLLF